MKLISISVILAALTVLLITSCGAPFGNSISTPNDGVPDGDLLTQGALVGVNGKTAAGTVLIYRQAPTQYVLRLSALSLTAEAGLKIIPTVDGTAGTAITLRATKGSQNYSLTLTTPPTTFNQVVIYSTANSLIYAQAVL